MSLGYGPKTVLDGLSFTFGAGRISVILGPGGSGKSTLLKALGGGREGVPRPWLRGRLELSAAVRASMSQKPPSGSLAGTTLAELLVPRPESVSSAASIVRDVWRVAPVAATFLEPVLEVPFGRLSHAHVRLAELTVAVAGAPLILLDEPEVGLEPEHREWVVRRLEDLRGERTVIVATHHLGVARAVADAAILLSDGRMVEAGEMPELFDRPRHTRTRQFVKMGS